MGSVVDDSIATMLNLWVLEDFFDVVHLDIVNTSLSLPLPFSTACLHINVETSYIA